MLAQTSPKARTAEILFGLSLLLFLATGLIGLDRFPIFFFCDEAIQQVSASELLAHGGRTNEGELLPTYFVNGESRNLSIGVYAQLLPTLLAGHSVFGTRATQVLLLLPAMAAVGLILRDFLGLRFWWIGVPLLSTAPAWFLHTRIAFELMLATAAYVGFLYFYLRYRSGRPRSVFPAVVCAALTFYGYNAFQLVLAVTGVVLLLADLPYHWRQRRMLLAVLPLLLLCALPYARFVHAHPLQIRQRLEGLGSYWVNPQLTTASKWKRFGLEYLGGFSPAYWSSTNPDRELIRHEMKGYPFVFPPVLLLAGIGLGLCLRRIRSPGARTLVVALAAAPVGGALVHTGVTRCMTFVVVVSMLAAVALDGLLTLLPRRVRPAWVAAIVFALFAALDIGMLVDSLLHAPTWFTNYGLYGLQWGAAQVFGAARAERARHPGWPVYVTPVWANAPENLLLFFCPGDPHVETRNIGYYRASHQDLTENAIHVLTAEEWESARGDPKFEIVQLERMLRYPDGSPAFYFIRMRYSPRIDALMAQEREERFRLQDEAAVVGGAPVCTSHSRFDIGDASSLFDGNLETLVRTAQVNPLIIELKFDAPQRVSGFLIALLTSGADARVRARLEPADGSAPLLADGTFAGEPADPIVELGVAGDKPVLSARVEIRLLGRPDDWEVHLRELTPIFRTPEASRHD